MSPWRAAWSVGIGADFVRLRQWEAGALIFSSVMWAKLHSK
jgi:hypothetical protein